MKKTNQARATALQYFERADRASGDERLDLLRLAMQYADKAAADDPARKPTPAAGRARERARHMARVTLAMRR